MLSIRSLINRLLTPVLDRFGRLEARVTGLECGLEQLQSALGRVETRQLGLTGEAAGLTQYEFSVFSQWGEDGIIQFLTKQINVDNKRFVEFGVEDYREANTRFLLMHDNWSGLVFDSSPENILSLRSSTLGWRYDLRAARAFITRDNINSLIRDNGFEGDIGLLSIDIDGNDYWIWQTIDVINPDIVVIEYNHRFGPELAVTIPYDESFRRGEKYPNVYFGASLRALVLLGNSKGYAFVGCNSHGVNAFFVRRDRLVEKIRELTPAEGYVAGKFSETRDERGVFVRASFDEEHRLVTSLPLEHVSGA